MKEEFKEEYSDMDGSRETQDDAIMRDTEVKDKERDSNDKKSRPPREKNKRFQDVESTGRWGAVDNRDKIIVGVIFLVIVAAVMTAVVLTTGRTKSASRPLSTPSPSPPPTIPPDVAAELQFPVIIHDLDNHTLVNSASVSRDITFYLTPANRANARNELEKAMFWSIIDDPLQPDPSNPWLIPRYVLASLYFATGGELWTNSSNWLTISSVCDWHGVHCDRFRDHVNEIDLANNNLVGTLPDSLNMMTQLVAITLSNNQLTGTVPWLALGSIPRLSYLSLFNNKLTGSLSSDIRANGVFCK
jgi:hypothetical protein